MRAGQRAGGDAGVEERASAARLLSGEAGGAVPPRTPAPTATRIETLTREVNAARAEAIRSRGFEEEMEDKLPLATGSTLVACGTHVPYVSHAHVVSRAAQRAA